MNIIRQTQAKSHSWDRNRQKFWLGAKGNMLIAWAFTSRPGSYCWSRGSYNTGKIPLMFHDRTRR